jgi:hypothetical protein
MVLYADDINILIIGKDENGLKEEITLLMNFNDLGNKTHRPSTGYTHHPMKN